MRIRFRSRPAPRTRLSVIREENHVLQQFARRHENELPPGMLRLLSNLDYAIRNGTLLGEKDLPAWLNARQSSASSPQA